MMTAKTTLNARTASAARDGRDIGFAKFCALTVMTALMVASPHGFSAAAGASAPGKAAAEKSASEIPASETTAVSAPITLAGRWQGPRYGYAFRGSAAKDCAGKRCELTYDIVACPQGWCGIAVSADTPCGAIAMRLKPDSKPNRRNAFSGKLELAKDTAPYTIEAWYAGPGDGSPAPGNEPPEMPNLHIIGDTGDGGMLMMRRSFPLEAQLTRISDAKCTLEQATS